MPSFRKKGRISIWVGFNRCDPAVDLLKDLCGVDSYDIDSQECVVDDKKWRQQRIERLLGQLSYSESFLHEAMDAAEQMGVSEALYVVVQYDFAFNPKKVRKTIAPDPVFLGCFSWSDAEDE